jgi:hypothetical protein
MKVIKLRAVRNVDWVAFFGNVDNWVAFFGNFDAWVAFFGSVD